MLAPSSLRHSPPGGGSDRRRSVRLVVLALTCAVLSVSTPLVLAGQVDGGVPDRRAAATTDDSVDPSTASDPAGRTTTVTAPGPAAGVSTVASSAASIAGTSAELTTGPAPADPAPVGNPAPASDTVAVPSADGPGAAAAPTVEPSPAQAPAPDPAPEPAVEQPAAAEQPPVEVEAVEPAGEQPAAAANWMEALRPQVDPDGLGTWVLQARGAWGATDGHTVYIDPDVPQDKRWSVMVHEYGHLLQVREYGSLDATAEAMNATVGAGAMDKGPTESNADCIAELLGATWTDYGCQDALRPAAAALVAGVSA